ncbi:MAG: hypothetical protein ACTHOB_16120 [Ginsengibacter sp.]
MKNEICKAFKGIDVNKLNDSDKLELLRFFRITKSAVIRNQIAFMFSDLNYDLAIPDIIKKINQKNLYNNNGSLVYALNDMNTKEYFHSFIKIICEQDYEARLAAFEIIQKDVSAISEKTKKEALKVLEKCRIKEEKTAKNKGEDSRLHFIEQTQKLIMGKISNDSHKF